VNAKSWSCIFTSCTNCPKLPENPAFMGEGGTRNLEVFPELELTTRGPEHLTELHITPLIACSPPLEAAMGYPHQGGGNSVPLGTLVTCHTFPLCAL